MGLPGCEKAPPSSDATAPASQPPRLIVLGLDAADLDLIGPWMDQGILPNLARLRDGGAHGRLASTEPSNSPVIWTSIATGKVPDKTGITSFVRLPDGPGKPVPVDRTQLRTSQIWKILSRRRIDVAVLGWYVTWPAEEVNGRLLSDFAHFGRVQDVAFPPSFLVDLPTVPVEDAIAAMPQFMRFEYDPAKAVRREGKEQTLDFLVYDRFVRAWSRDRYYLEAAERTLTDGPLPEAFFLYLRGTDDVQHGFWKFMDPESFASPELGDRAFRVPPEQVAAFGEVIKLYWRWTDMAVGRILSHYEGHSPLVLVCSDHGAGPATGKHEVEAPEYLHLSGAHRPDGVLLASGPGIRQGVEIEGASIYDVTPTILHALGLPVGEDMDGRVLTGLFEEPLASRADAKIPTWDQDREDRPAEQAPPKEVEDKVLEHLRSLGYIDQ